jgi:hypothetical protein
MAPTRQTSPAGQFMTDAVAKNVDRRLKGIARKISPSRRDLGHPLGGADGESGGHGRRPLLDEFLGLALTIGVAIPELLDVRGVDGRRSEPDLGHSVTLPVISSALGARRSRHQVTPDDGYTVEVIPSDEFDRERLIQLEKQASEASSLRQLVKHAGLEYKRRNSERASARQTAGCSSSTWPRSATGKRRQKWSSSPARREAELQLRKSRPSRCRRSDPREVRSPARRVVRPHGSDRQAAAGEARLRVVDSQGRAPDALGLEVRKVKPGTVQAVLDKFAATHAPATVQRLRNVMSKMFSQAVAWELCATNPVKPTSTPGAQKKKLTIPDKDNLYADLIKHKNVLRVVALSGGYSRDDANKRLARNNGMTASFSRALAEGLTAQQSDKDFNGMLDKSIESIYQASIT